MENSLEGSDYILQVVAFATFFNHQSAIAALHALNVRNYLQSPNIIVSFKHGYRPSGFDYLGSCLAFFSRVTRHNLAFHGSVFQFQMHF
jgi:hypothetical protein